MGQLRMIPLRHFLMLSSTTTALALDGLFGFLYFALVLILQHTPSPLIFGKIRQVLMRSTHLGYTWVLSVSTDVLLFHDILTSFSLLSWIQRPSFSSSSRYQFWDTLGIRLDRCGLRLNFHRQPTRSSLMILPPFVNNFDNTLLLGYLPRTTGR